MIELAREHLQVEVLNIESSQFNITDEEIIEIGMEMEGGDINLPGQTTGVENKKQQEYRLGIQVTFAPTYISKFAVRMRVTMDGRFCHERVIENSRVHKLKGHIILIKDGADNTRRDSHFPNIENDSSSSTESPSPSEHALLGRIIVTFQEVKDVRYFSTPKEETYERRERMACKAEAMMGNKAPALRIPLDRIVDCGHGSMSWDYVHEDQCHFAMFRFRRRVQEGSESE